jgi:phosphoribosylglycinamide formyltransferase-1
VTHRRVAILISGGGSNMMALVRSMTGDHPARPVLVLSNDPQAGGLARAAAEGLPPAVVDHRPFGADRQAFERALSAELDRARPDVICLAGFMRILTPSFIGRYAGRMLNIHPSLLPRYPGLHTHQRALDSGDAEAGCSVHEVTADLDAGPLVAEHRLYPAVLRRFCAGDRSLLTL